MKPIIYFFIALWALAACTQSSEELILSSDRSTQLTVTLASSNPSTKAEGTIATEAEKQLNSVDIFIFNKEENLLKKQRFTGSEISVTGGMKMQVQVGICNIFVLANIPATLADKVTSITDLNKLEVNLESQYNTTNGMVMSGKELNKGIVADAVNSCKISLERISAKVNLNWTIDLPAPLESSNLEVKRVFILNNFENSTLIGGEENALAVNTRIHGKDGVTVPESILPSKYAAYLDKNIETGNQASFYLFENRIPVGDIETSAYTGTKIIIEALYSGNTEPTTYYYPIIINKLADEDTLTPVKRNTAYQITAKIKGLSGVLDPYEPVVSRDLEISLEVIDWITIEQSVDFN